MVLSMAKKSDICKPESIVIIGSNVAAIQAALTLARMGVVVKLVASLVALDWSSVTSNISGSSSLDRRFLYPLLLQAAGHPLITLYTSAEVESIKGETGDYKVQVIQRPRYVREDVCTSCGRCQIECSVKIASLLGGERITHSAIHAPLLGVKSIPSAYVIDKNGTAPCEVACPLGINVQGFVSLLANGKTDSALALINDAAPLAGILGRVCPHPCEDACNRAQVDKPVFIRALHRYAADNANGRIRYDRKFPAKSREGKIAIVGSGPAGLTAAWELTRLGYSPVIFESHGVIGGMLATGIPRFRLPREVREREIEAIKNLGIDIRTGITVGRDVTFSYLKERGYRAFFLAIGAQRNSKLNIPGEELHGVVDCMPLLLTLNLKVDIVDTFVDSNVVVIGGGNAAIDAARAALRSRAKEVTIFYRRTRDEMPANAEEVEEAISEGVNIEYNTVPIEVLGDGGRVTGIRCQRTKSGMGSSASRKYEPEPIPGTGFIKSVDHVVVAIGQAPNASQLGMGSLAIDGDTGIIEVNPLTLETSIPGVFAGGDCITGPNNVVDAMAAGLRVAESINLYMQGRDIEAERSLEPPQVAEIDLRTMEILPGERAHMPAIRLRKRVNSFEETTTGLSVDVSRREAQRCLNCALCSQCMECTRVCELDAVFHDDCTKRFELDAQIVLRFPPGASEENIDAHKAEQESTMDGVRIFSSGDNGVLTEQVMKAMAIAMETAINIRPKGIEENRHQDFTASDTNICQPHLVLGQTIDSAKRIGVFLCRCGGSINSVIDFKTVVRKLSRLTGVVCIREINQACTEAGAKEIADQVTELQLDRIVLAACRCCNSEQLCYACTDRRIMCQQYLNQYLILPHNTVVEFVNIREQCAWVHADNPKGATRKAVQIVSAGIARAKIIPFVPLGAKSILPTSLIIGGGLANITAAKALASQGYRVEFVSRQILKQGQHETKEAVSSMLEQLRDKGVIAKPWPDALKLNGSPGNYEVIMNYDHQVDCVSAGAVLVNIEELNKGASPLLRTDSDDGLLSRIIDRTSNSDYLVSACEDILRDITIKETSGIFLLLPSGDELPEDQILRGFATAARVLAYLHQGSISPRAMAVNIESKLCRGCGDCAGICPYIEMRKSGNDIVYAYIDKALCLGCGACVSVCPAGAITQSLQSDKQIIHTLSCMLRSGQVLSGV